MALQASVLGMIATLGRRIACVNAFIGLGYSFTSNTVKARAVRRSWAPCSASDQSRRQYRAGAERRRLAALAALGIAKHRIALISGSGVDIRRFTPLPEPQGPPTFGFVGRLLDDKGVRTLVAAFRLLRARGTDTDC